MKRFVSVLFLALGSFGFARSAAAQNPSTGVDEFGSYGRNRDMHYESPQNGALEARFGRYIPQIDKTVPGSPFKDAFGSTSRYMFGLEGDWQALRIPHLGTLGPGLGWGYTRATGKARITATGKPAAEDTALSIMPFYLVAVFRADVLARDYSIPIVPYAKLGMGYALWWASDGGNTARENGVLGKGVSFGPQFALGGMFLLDFLDEQTARDADNGLGINNSYIFAEWLDSELDAFGSKNRLNVGANSWVMGLAIEF
ncbi:MAG: MXAN_2562 family outer membrane beta-barrel protein [Polyangiaceae bacterium]